MILSFSLTVNASLSRLARSTHGRVSTHRLVNNTASSCVIQTRMVENKSMLLLNSRIITNETEGFPVPPQWVTHTLLQGSETFEIIYGIKGF